MGIVPTGSPLAPGPFRPFPVASPCPGIGRSPCQPVPGRPGRWLIKTDDLALVKPVKKKQLSFL